MKKCISCSNHYESDFWVCPDCRASPSILNGFLVFCPELAFENPGFDGKYFENLAQIEEGSFWFRSRNRLILWAIHEYFPRARTFLEIGCGTGYVISGVRNAFPQIQVSGSEIFLAGLPFVKQRLPDVPLYQIDAHSIPFVEEFDVIGAFDVLEHIEDDQKVLKEIANAVCPGGGILLTVPQHAWLWSQVDDFSYHKRRYARSDLVQKLEAAGFRVRKVTSFVFLLMPLMALARLRYLIPFCKADYHLEFKMGKWLNAFLEKVMTLELSLIRAGMDFRFGASLFIVATKE